MFIRDSIETAIHNLLYQYNIKFNDIHVEEWYYNFTFSIIIDNVRFFIDTSHSSLDIIRIVKIAFMIIDILKVHTTWYDSYILTISDETNYNTYNLNYYTVEINNNILNIPINYELDDIYNELKRINTI